MTVQSADHQVEVWREYACSYDCVVGIMPYYRAVLDRHERLIANSGCRNIVDIGAGTGNLSVRLADRGFSVTAIDSSEAMLEGLRSKLSGARRRQIRVLHANAEHIDEFCADESFDAVTILLALFDMERPLIALTKGIRLLQPGGLLVLTEPKRCFDKRPIINAVRSHLEQFELLSVLEEDYRRVVHSNEEIDPSRRPNRLWAEDIAELLRERGFPDLRCEDSHFGQCATVSARKPKETD
jgi:ubiquinone/menaquinone biosynthesis C-methylase UbiE